ncbi:MAG: glycosyltransferase, partial [Brooklawnia sp.]
SNISEFDRYVVPKTGQANRTVAMIGWNSAVKDPAWCLEMFEALHDADNSWRLQLIGHDMTPQDDYSRAVLERIDRLGSAVRRVPFTHDISGALTGVGVIVSSSLSEGAPMAVAEGAASGALPVVRDWPALADWGGPREIYPAEWVVESAQQGAERVLGFGDAQRAQAGAEASEWVLANLDAEAALRSYLSVYFPQEQHV